MDPTLDYLDQASFLGLRALGHGPVNQFVWVYHRPVDLATLRRFHAGLGVGLLGRLVETSVLPFGRHRWVRAASPPLELIDQELPEEQIGTWLDEQAALSVDPEHGPGWRLLVRPLAGGGTVVVLLVSHTLADGLGTCEAITAAVTGAGGGPAYPPAGARTPTQALREDTRTAVRSLPDTGRAVSAALRVPRPEGRESPRRARRRPGPRGPGVTVPSALLTGDADQWRTRAHDLNGTTTSLLGAFAALVARCLGRTHADGRVRLVLPVSLRTPGDTRGNALSSISVTVAPAEASADLRPVRAAQRSAMAELSECGNALLAPVALTPYVPRRLVRRLEVMALGQGLPVGLSHLGSVAEAVNRPDGTDADRLWVRSLESLTRRELDDLDGTLRVASVIVAGRVGVSVSAWQSGRVESRAALAGCVAAAADELGLAYRLD